MKTLLAIILAAGHCFGRATGTVTSALVISAFCAASLPAAQQTVNEGSEVTLSVTFKGGVLQPGSTVPDQSTGHTFQWFKSGQAITGATAREYRIAAATVADVANYTVRITNAAGTTLSDTAAISLLVTPKEAVTAVATKTQSGGTAPSAPQNGAVSSADASRPASTPEQET